MDMTLIRPFKALTPVVNLTVGTSSTNVAITRGGIGTQTVRLTNSGANVVFFQIGKDNTVAAAAATSVPMLPNTTETFLVQNDELFVAAISAASGNTLFITTGEGS